MELTKGHRRTWCNCGVNVRLHPHDLKFCGAKLSTRLKKLEEYMHKLPWSLANYNLSCVRLKQINKTQTMTITAFPHLLALSPSPTGCVICGQLITTTTETMPLVYKVVYKVQRGTLSQRFIEAYACETCWSKGLGFCPLYFRDARWCDGNAVIMLGLCMKALGLPRDVRLLIRKWAFPRFPQCDHQ